MNNIPFFVKPYHDPNLIRTCLAPFARDSPVKCMLGGLEFKGIYSRDVVPAIIPLNFTGIKNISPPTYPNDLSFRPPIKFDPVKAGVPIMVTNIMPHAYCPIL